MLFTPLRVSQDRSLLIRDGSSSLVQRDSVKILGISLDHHLSWHDQIDTICKRLSTKNFAMLQLRDHLDYNTLKTFYYAAINSILSYGLLMWGNYTDIARVLRSQKRIIRTMFRLQYKKSYRQIFGAQSILTVINLYILQCACNVFKNQHSYFTFGDRYQTRNSSNIYIPSARLTQIQDDPKITSLKIYNHLPLDLRSANSDCIFGRN